MSTIRAVVAGCGSIWPVWDRMLRDRGVPVLGFVDPEPSRAATAAVGFTGAKPFAGIREALSELAAANPSLLVNLTPPAAHAEVTMAALRAGLDVISEKPLAADLADGLRVVAAARSAGRSVSVMQNRRHEANFGPLAEFAVALPGPVYVSCDFFVPWTYGGFRDEMASPLLEDLLIHPMDQARCLVAAEPEWVFCHESTIAGSWMAGDAVVTSAVGFADGSVFGYRGSWCGGGKKTSWNGRWRVSAHHCSAHWDGEHAAYVVESELDDASRPTGRCSRRILGPPDAGAVTGHERGLDEILGALAGRRPSRTDAAANLHSVAMIAAARASAAGHRIVALREVYADAERRR